MSDGHKNSLFRESTYVLISMIVSGVFTFLISVSLARILGPEEFGIYALVVSTQMVVFSVAFFGIGPAISKFIAEVSTDETLRKRRIAKIGIGFTILLSSFTSLVYVALSSPIGLGLYGEAEIVFLIPFSALVVISSAFQGTVFGIVQGMRRLSYIVWMQVAPPSASLLLVLLIVPSVGLAGAFIAASVAQTIASLAMLILLSRRGFSILVKVPPEFRKSTLKKVFGFSLPSTLSSLLQLPMYWLGNTALTFTVGLAAVGLFAVARTLYAALLVLPNAIIIPLFPKISEMSTMSMEYIQATMVKTVHHASILLFPVFFAAAIFSGLIIDVAYGGYYDNAAGVTMIMLFLCYFAAIMGVLGTLLTGMGRMWLGLLLDVIYSISFVIALLIIVPSFGLIGLGLTFVISTGLRLIALACVVRRTYRFDFSQTYGVMAVVASIFLIEGYLMLSYSSIGLVLNLILFIVGMSIMLLVGRKVYVSFAKRILRSRHSSRMS